MHGAARRIERLQEPEPLRACMKTLHILSLAPAGASAVPDSEGVPPRRVSPSPQVGHLRGPRHRGAMTETWATLV